MTDPVICHLCGKTIDEDEISMSKIWPVRAHGWCSRVWIEHELAQIDANKLKEIRAHKAAPLVPTKTEELNKTEPDKEERPSRDEISMSKHAERRAQNELREQIGELKFSAEAYEEEEKQTQESQLNSLREEIAAAEERAANKLKEIRAHKAAMQPQETQG